MSGPASNAFRTLRVTARSRTTIRQCHHLKSPSVKAFSTSSVRSGTGNPSPNTKDSQHVLDKKNDPNAQSDASSTGVKNKEAGTGGTATSRSDSTNATAKAKQQHPEAPDTVIGMQDERGGKGA